MSDWWKPKDYDAAVKENAKNPDPDLASAIQGYQAKHNQSQTEDRGAREGFISQQFPQNAEASPGEPSVGVPRIASGPAGDFQISPEVPPRDEKLIAEARVTDPSLRSAGKRKVLYAPPEALAPPDPSMPWMDVLKYIPSWAGGGTEMWREPSLEEFRQYSGDKANGLDETSQEYRDFADAKWLDRYNRAHEKGENVVRTAYAADDLTANIAQETPDVGTAGLLGASKMIAPGLLTEALPWLAEATGAAPPGARERVQSVMKKSPIATAVGAVAGAPYGLAGAIGKGASELTGLTPELMSGAPSFLQSIIRGTGAGALTGAAVEGANDVASAAVGNGSDQPEELQRLLEAGLGGGLFGGLAGGGAAFSEALRNPLNEPSGPQLMIMDKALGRPATRLNPFSPIRVSPEVEAAVAEAKAPGASPRRPYDILAGKVAPRIEAAQKAEDQALEAAIVAKNNQYYEKPVAKQRKQGRSIAAAVKDTLKRLTMQKRPPEAGGTSNEPKTIIPGAKNAPKPPMEEASTQASAEPIPGAGSDIGLYRRLYNDTHDFIPESGLGLRVQQIALREGGNVISARQAREFGAELPIDVPDSARVVEAPKLMNARQYDEAVYRLDKLAKADAKTGASDRELGYFQKAIREDRDQFPGLNDLHAESNALLEKFESRSKLAGTPQGKNVPASERVASIKNSVQGFGQPGRGDVDEAQMSFLENPGPLYQIAAARGAGAMGQPGLGRTGMVERTFLTLDPVARAMADFGLPAAAAAGPIESAATKVGQTTKKAGKNLGRKTKRFLTE